ncbi:MAG: WcaF family extracellular polysaccharide biosynthesis acetyltransferase [Planctomycetales bacterium]|nr:WcaF family extracellular polysaccharide biosynthesis acetyltransferase [Planctomycetales bacterium]
MIDLSLYKSEFDRGAPIWKECLWQAIKCVFFMLPIPLPSQIRRSLLRCFGARIGKRVVLRECIDITFPWRLTIGDNTWVGKGVALHNLDEIAIGKNCCISQRAFLCSGSHDFRSDGFELITKPIVIGDSCWIAANVFIAPGVQMGQGSMAIAGSVILNAVSAGTIVIGNPATVRRKVEV